MEAYNATVSGIGMSGLAAVSDFVPTISAVIVASVVLVLLLSNESSMRKLLKFVELLKNTSE